MQRHELIYLKNNVNYHINSPLQAKNDIKIALNKWIRASLPFVYTRQSVTSKDQIQLGLTLLVHNACTRISVAVPSTDIIKTCALPTLNQFFPLEKNKLVNIFYHHAHVYGSYLFSCLSKQSLVHADSDLDLLINYHNESIPTIHFMLKTLENRIKIKIDGEIRFKNIGDIAIKELIMLDAASLLVKTVHNVFLIPRTTLYEYYPSLRPSNA